MRAALRATLILRLPAPCHVAAQGLPASARLIRLRTAIGNRARSARALPQARHIAARAARPCRARSLARLSRTAGSPGVANRSYGRRRPPRHSPGSATAPAARVASGCPSGQRSATSAVLPRAFYGRGVLARARLRVWRSARCRRGPPRCARPRRVRLRLRRRLALAAARFAGPLTRACNREQSMKVVRRWR